MSMVNESAPIRLANAKSQLRRRIAVCIVPRPIAYRRQKFNAIASTTPARSTEQGHYKKTARNWALIYGSLNMAFPERRTVDILLTTALLAAVAVTVYCVRRVILIFVFAILFSYLLDPVVKFLQRHSLFFRNLRGPAVVEVYLAFVLLIAFAGYTFAPSLARSTTRVLDEAPAFLNSLSTGDIASDLRGKYGWSESQELRFRVFLAGHKQDIQSLVPTVDRYLSNAAQIVGCLLLVPILAIFFLRDGHRIVDALIRLLIHTDRRPKIHALVDQLHQMLTEYIRAQLLLCLLSFVFYSAALLVLRFPHAIVLGILGGLLEFIPVVGWTSTFAVVVGVGILNHSHWVWMAALLGSWRVIQDYFATPRIMGSHLKIHPLAAIFAGLVGAEIGGIVGIYLAVPVMASFCMIWRSVAEERANRGCVSDREAVVSTSSNLVETAIS
jgi:predicted PurR-regulated permease PerM